MHHAPHASAICGGVLAVALAAALSAQQVDSFRPVATFGVRGAAETVAAIAGGRALLYTDSRIENVGVVDIADPRQPKSAGGLRMPGVPTGVSASGRYAVVAVWVDPPDVGEPPPQFRAGKLVVLDVADPRDVKTLGTIDIGYQPDGVQLTTIGRQLVAVVAIENEPVVVEDDKVVDTRAPGHPGDVGPAGLVQVVTVDTGDPSRSKVVDVALPAAAMTRAGLLYPKDPQPESVALHGSIAAVSLQENNGVVRIDLRDPAQPRLLGLFSTGVVADRRADLSEDDDIRFDERYPSYVDGDRHPVPKDGGGNDVTPGIRCPDGLAFSPDGGTIFTADEGELPYTGGRGFSWWSPTGSLRGDDGGRLEQIVVALSHYPEDRSEQKGAEVEGIAAARFGDRDMLFVLSERGSFMAVYRLGGRAPRLIQILPTGSWPETVISIPARGLVVTADERSGTLSIFQGQRGLYRPSPDRPRLYSSRLQPWSAISGLDPGRYGSYLWGIPDSAVPTKIYWIDVGSGFARLVPLISVRKGREQQRYDGEGIVRDRSIVAPWFLRGWWLASEGNTRDRPNLVVQVSAFGQVRREIQLPHSIDPAADPDLPGKAQPPANGKSMRSNGIEGITVSRDRRHLVAAIQREFIDEFPAGDKFTRIARYDLRQIRTSSQRRRLCNGLRCGGDWDFFYYKLDSNHPSNWAGLAEIIAIGDDEYLVLERDRWLGLGSRLKRAYAFSLRGLKPDTDGKPDATDTVKKVLALDVLDDFFPFEKIEGLALHRGQLWIGLDNDGGELESRLVNTGKFRNPLR